MRNELLLFATLILYYGFTVLWYKLFGRAGIYSFTAFATIVANIEVLILVHAYGMDQTLGNVMFATTFTCSEILSELEGTKYAKINAWIGIATTALFMFVSQTWAWYVPIAGQGVSTEVQEVFRNSPRIMLSSLVVYGVCQLVQVGVYALVWKIQKHAHGGLWIRSNVATLVAQLVNTILFTIFAFIGVYDMSTLIAITVSSYAIFIVTSLYDTLVLYFARRTCKKNAILFKETI